VVSSYNVIMLFT